MRYALDIRGDIAIAEKDGEHVTFECDRGTFEGTLVVDRIEGDEVFAHIENPRKMSIH